MLRQLSAEEFADGLRDMGIDVPKRDIAALMLYFDTDRRYVHSYHGRGQAGAVADARIVRGYGHHTDMGMGCGCVCLGPIISCVVSGKISVDELQKGLAGPMNERRLGLIREAFTRCAATATPLLKLQRSWCQCVIGCIVFVDAAAWTRLETAS